MVMPIVAFGHPILRKRAEAITPECPELKRFIEDLWETMYQTDGVGLAAPQVNRSIRIFVIDGEVFSENYPEAKGFKKCFINAELIAEEGVEWEYTEGCLSIPDIHEPVIRKPRILLKYQDESFTWHEEWFEGINARVIQHEYDHLEGKLFTDHLSHIRKMMLRNKLSDISHGKTKAAYRMIFPVQKRKR